MGARAANGMRSVFKYPGSKGGLRDRIVQLLPHHRVYCEPFGGSAAVLLAKPPAPVEWYNDTDHIVVDLFRLLRDGGADLDALCDRVGMTPYAREELRRARDNAAADDRLERMRNFLVRSWFSRMGAVNDHRTGWKVANWDAKAVSAWNTVPERLRQTANRFKTVHIESCDAVDLMLRLDSDSTVMYVDPPYPEESINFRKTKIYSSRFETHRHVDLLGALGNLRSRVILSGYRHPIYDDALATWRRIDVPHIVMSGATKTESLWLNFDPPDESA